MEINVRLTIANEIPYGYVSHGHLNAAMHLAANRLENEAARKFFNSNLVYCDNPYNLTLYTQEKVYVGEDNGHSVYKNVDVDLTVKDINIFAALLIEEYRKQIAEKSFMLFSDQTDDPDTTVYRALNGAHANHEMRITANRVGDCGAYNYQVACSCGANYANDMNGCWQWGHQRKSSGDPSLAAYETI